MHKERAIWDFLLLRDILYFYSISVRICLTISHHFQIVPVKEIDIFVCNVMLFMPWGYILL